MYPASLKSIESPTVRARIAVERRIVRSLLNDAVVVSGAIDSTG